MTVKELRETLMGYPPDMEVRLSTNRLVHPATEVDVCVDMNSNTKYCVIYADTKTWEDEFAEAKEHLEKLRNKLEVAGV